MWSVKRTLSSTDAHVRMEGVWGVEWREKGGGGGGGRGREGGRVMEGGGIRKEGRI